MDLIKKNKYTIIAIVVFIILVFCLYQAKELFFPNTGKAIYGDRLVGKVEVDKEVYKTVKSKIKENEKVKEVTTRENDKLINISIVVNDDTSIDDAKKLTDSILEPFTDSQKGYYDFQVFISKESEAENNFPIIAYKHHNSSGFVWTKNRDKTEGES